MTPDEKRKKRAARRLANREKLMAYQREWRAKNRADPARLARFSRYSVAYQKRKKASDPIYHAKSCARARRYYKRVSATPEGRARVAEASLRAYYRMKADPSRYAKYREAERIRRAKRMQRDPNFALRCHLRVRLADMIREGRAVKRASAVMLVGCTLDELRRHIEKQFKRGMTWANYGSVWHIDHIIPCAKFDLTDERQQRLCFHYLNLQPLRVEENLRKQDKLVAPAQMPLLLPAS